MRKRIRICGFSVSGVGGAAGCLREVCSRLGGRGGLGGLGGRCGRCGRVDWVDGWTGWTVWTGGLGGRCGRGAKRSIGRVLVALGGWCSRHTNARTSRSCGLCQGKSETLGLNIDKVQEIGCCYSVGARRISIPTRPTHSQQAGSEPACVLVTGGLEPGVARMQAVILSPEIVGVVVRWDNRASWRGKADAVPLRGRQQFIGAPWRVPKTPPGSETRACIHKGSSGTWESRRSPCIAPGDWVHRLSNGPGDTGMLPPGVERTSGVTRYREASVTRSDPGRDGGSLSGA